MWGSSVRASLNVKKAENSWKVSFQGFTIVSVWEVTKTFFNLIFSSMEWVLNMVEGS